MEEELNNDNAIKTMYTYDTVYCADSLEWCPHDPHQNIFVCANYQLIKEDGVQKRVGRILLFSISPKNGLNLLHTLNTPAILDQKWCHKMIDGQSLLGITNSEGSVEIYKLCYINDSNITLVHVCSLDIRTRDVSELLILSLDWSTGKCMNSEPEIVCSDSQGSIHRLKYQNGSLTLISSWNVHSFEAWISAFYYWDPHITFTGGDDCLMFKFDNRVGSSPVTKIKHHEAGVTSIHSNNFEEYTIASGSYDSKLRVWDVRYLRNPLHQLDMPDTLWRVKWHPSDSRYLLTACMLGGAHIVEVRNNDMQVVESYYGHKSLVYGVDWSYLSRRSLENYGDGDGGDCVIGSCSFYDHLLCVSKVKFGVSRLKET